MNIRKTAIALAVAGATVAAPVASFAADEVFASARVGLWNRDSGGESDFAVRSFSSRFGAAGETDLGNGLTAYGRYEWDVDFNDDDDGGRREDDPATTADEGADGENDISVRQRWVGLKGDFGSVQIGQGWWTFYSFAVAPTDNPWWHSGYAMINYRGRTDNAITYTGGSGDIAFGVSAYFDTDREEDAPDQLEVGASFGIGDMTLGLALHTSEAASIGNGLADSSGDPESVFGAALSGISLGAASLGVSFQSQDDDTSLVLDLGIGNAYVHIETESLDADDRDRTGITLGYTQSLGRKTTMYYEFWTLDEDTDDSDDDSQNIMAVLVYNII